MNALGKTLAAVIGLASLGALGVGGYFALELVFGFFASLESEAARAAVCASAVALLAAIIIASSIRQAGRQIAAALAEMRRDPGPHARGVAAEDAQQPLRPGAAGPAGAPKQPPLGSSA